MFFALPFPMIDPVLVQIGPFAIRWYALAYIAGIVLGWRLARRLVVLGPKVATTEQVDDFVTWVTLGIILGGRFGYVIFYRPDIFLRAPWEILYLWQGGMSFHGGALGVIVALYFFTRRQGLNWVAFSDRVVCVVPIGIFLGRLANFINGELWGRVSDVPWAMVFPGAGPDPRHPSQLYQAGLEGLCLFILLMVLVYRPAVRTRAGVLSGVFLGGYGVARFIGEFFRQPDAHLGFLFAGATMGQLLSLPMMAVGAWLVVRGMRRGPMRS